jgi:hypothetical protein
MSGVTLRASEIPVRFFYQSVGRRSSEFSNLALGSYSSKHLRWAGEIPVLVFHQPAVERSTAYSHSRILSALYRASEILVLASTRLGNLQKVSAFVASFPLIFRDHERTHGTVPV